jgi:antitoxin YefM
MAEYISYSKARAELARLCNKVAEDREVVYITRRSKPDVALISAEDVSSLLETAHLLRSPKNARRLLTALNRALAREVSPSSLEELKRDVGLDE